MAICPALDSPEDIKRGAELCLFIQGSTNLTRSLKVSPYANIAGSLKVSDCLSINLYFMEVGDVEKYLPTGNARVTQRVTKIFVRFSTDFQRVTRVTAIILK